MEDKFTKWNGLSHIFISSFSNFWFIFQVIDFYIFISVPYWFVSVLSVLTYLNFSLTCMQLVDINKYTLNVCLICQSTLSHFCTTSGKLTRFNHLQVFALTWLLVTRECVCRGYPTVTAPQASPLGQTTMRTAWQVRLA